MNETVAAVVVTYNRKQLLTECLDALLAQTRPVDKIILIDNASTDGTPEMLREHGYLDNPVIDCVRLPENTGGAGGFHEGVKRGYEAGYDWVWLMDDDAEPLSNTLENLIGVINNKKIYLLCPLIIMKDGRVQNYHHKFIKKIPFADTSAIPQLKNVNQIKKPSELIKIDASAFVGPIVSKKLIEIIGYPNPQLFIWGDDTEYTYRATSAGFDIYLTLDSFIYHKDKGYAFDKKIAKNDYWKIYHGTKNKIYISYCYIGKISAVTVLIRTIFSFYNKQVTFELYKKKLRGLFDGFIMIRRNKKLNKPMKKGI